MMNKLKIKIKEIKEKDNSKNFMTKLTVFIFLGIALILASNNFAPTKTTNSDSIKQSYDNDVSPENTKSTNNDLIQDYSNNIESELKEILSQIKGVGDVKIMVNLEDTAEKIPAFNTTTVNENTNEKDAGGGAREVVREDLKQEVVTANGESLMIIKEVKPSVKGVIVVAEGAEDTIIKEQLYSAVKTVLGISGNKVEVYSSK